MQHFQDIQKKYDIKMHTHNLHTKFQCNLFIFGSALAKQPGVESKVDSESSVFFAWVNSRFESIPEGPLESWVDLSQFPGKPLELRFESIQLSEAPLESWVDLNRFSGRHLSHNPQKSSHQFKTLVESPKKVIRSEIQWKTGYSIKGIFESWVDSNQYSRTFFESWGDFNQNSKAAFE